MSRNRAVALIKTACVAFKNSFVENSWHTKMPNGTIFVKTIDVDSLMSPKNIFGAFARSST